MRAFTIDLYFGQLALKMAQLDGVNKLLKYPKKRLDNKTKKSLAALAAEFTMARDLELEIIYGRIRAEIAKITDKNIVTIIASAAGQLFERQLHEFVKNAVDAHATEMKFELHINTQGKAQITISDNGTTPIPLKKTGKYCWQKRVLESSAKAKSRQLGGCNLGLATSANFLEKIGEGSLALDSLSPNGAKLTLTSSVAPCAINMDHFSFACYVWELIHDLKQEFSTRSPTQEERDLLEALKTAYKYPEGFFSKRDGLLRAVAVEMPAVVVLGLPTRVRRGRCGGPESSPLINNSIFSPTSSNVFSPSGLTTAGSTTSRGDQLTPLFLPPCEAAAPTPTSN